MAEYAQSHVAVIGEGHRPNTGTIALELHRLLSIFLASKSLAELRTQSGDSWREPFDKLQAGEEDEITRILLAVAITARVIDDREGRVFDLFCGSCGTLEATTPKKTSTKDLSLREACNKLIHAQKVRFDVEATEANQRYLNPTMYLYGEHAKGSSWRATLNVIQFVKWYALCIQHY